MSPILTKATEQTLRELWEIGAFKVLEKPVPLAANRQGKDSPHSPVYINLRSVDNPKPGPLKQQHYDRMAAEVFARLNKCNIAFNCIAGIPNAGSPFAEAFSRVYERHTGKELRLIPLIKETRLDGSFRFFLSPAYFSGRGPHGRRDDDIVGLFDDLITESAAKAAAKAALMDAGYPVSVVAVYMDREQGGSKSLRAEGTPVVSVVTLATAVEFYESIGWLTGADLLKVQEYIAQVRVI